MTRLTPYQTAAALARVMPAPGGFRVWTPGETGPVYPSRREAEEASVQEWRDNLEPKETT